MDAISPTKRNSRWDRNPRLDKNGKPTIAHLTKRDIEIFKLLQRYRYLPSDYIHAFFGGDYQSLIKRLDLLYRKPNLYLNRPPQQREHADANYRKLIYELDERGAQVLRDRGIDVPKRKYHRNFAHELMVCQISASFELGTIENPQVRIIRWPDIMASDRFPAGTRKLPSPATIPIGDESITADGEPFVLARERDGAPLMTFFPGFEADCGTEPIDASDSSRSSIRAKFRLYLNIMEQRLFRDHFGTNTFTVLFVTTNQARMESMMDLLKRMDPGPHARHFLFKHMPAFTSYKQSAPATGHILTEPWKRVGHSDFNLDK